MGEIGGVFVSKQPSDTDMGAKETKTDGWEQRTDGPETDESKVV